MIRATAAPDAPPTLVAATQAVRRLIVAVSLDGRVHGWCVEASLILGWMLLQQGLPAEMRSCSAEGSPHWCIRSGDWILDPTSGQWGEEPLLVFREGSSDDWYGPGWGGPADISEDEIVHRFALMLSPETAAPLLALAGLTHLEGAIEQASDELRMIRAAEYPDEAGDATPPPSVGAA
jgi:hypothetical protein